ncbi:hypothetical protein Pan189_28510 [Stratiformator vulcanicus]|uniref:Glycosyltransferase RgtA/B/C/D-like domain-containing protein n=2 Tax=Stratiformator vulcanicus TaxID=2527980 RepID=A0A517R3M9_9PLAN|nr:hypothetical protein Pan189_28510 [Stratiformator vulcanicus]
MGRKKPKKPPADHIDRPRPESPEDGSGLSLTPTLLPGRPSSLDIAAFVLTAAAAVLLTLPIPLGIPGEWAWERIEQPLWLSAFAAVPAIFALVVYVGFVRRASRYFFVDAPRARAVSLMLLVCGGFVWLWVAQQTPIRSQHRLGKAAVVLYFPSSSGYYTLAANDARNLGSFLASYEDRMRKGDVLHIGTHPPGLVVAYRSLLAIFEASPFLTRFAINTEPHSAREVFRSIGEDLPAVSGELTPAAEATIWTFAMLTQLAAAATVVPLYFLIRRFVSDDLAWNAAALWPLTPAVALFLPKSDLLLPLFGCCFLALWAASQLPGRWWLAIPAAAVALIGMTLSLALLPIVAVVGVFEILRMILGCQDRGTIRSALLRGGAAAAFVALILICFYLAGVDLLSIWRLNLWNHARFYDEFSRSYFGWLAVNPLELLIAAGPAICCAAAIGLWRELCRPALTDYGALMLAIVIVWSGLWISGKNSGEVARLWILLMPLLVVLSAAAITNEERDKPRSATRLSPSWIAIAQGFFTLYLIGTVTGFAIAGVL